MNTAELSFRHFIGPAMRGKWMMAWHEDRHISPGIPDLHYVMVNEEDHRIEYRVGWLELKAIDTDLFPTRRIKVEPSQHQFMRRWLPHMPIHFLIRVKKTLYLVDGIYHATVPEIHNASDMQLICTATCNQADVVKVLVPILKTLTRI